MSTAARNKLDKLERSLKKKLESFYNSKIKGSPIPVDILKQKYNKQVQDIIRKAAQESYLVGTDEVANQVLAKDQDFQLFISGTDLNNIQQLTDRLSNDFWNTARRLQDREAAVTEQGVKKAPFDAVAALTGIAAGLVFSAFNNAIVSKSTQIALAPQVPIIEQFPILGFEDPLTLEVGFEVSPVPRVRFVTQEDSRVDPELCGPLHDTEYFVDDPLLPEPPLHKFCRCVLVPVIE